MKRASCKYLASPVAAALLMTVARVASAQSADGWNGAAGGAWNGAQPQQPSPTEARLAEAESKDSKRPLEILWVRGELGGSYVNMTSFSQENMNLQQSSAAGPAYSVAAGVRLVVLSLGVRAKLNQLSSLNLWQVNGVVGLHIPLGDLEPSVSLFGGYSFSGKLSQDSLKTAYAGEPTKEVTVTGFNAGVGVNLDYYVAKNISLGGGVTGEGLFLKREKAPLPSQFSLLPAAEQQAILDSPYYKNSGSSAGFGMSALVRAGVHF